MGLFGGNRDEAIRKRFEEIFEKGSTETESEFLNSLNEITTAIGTLYDKRALAKGESTTNASMTIKMDKKVEELSQ